VLAEIEASLVAQDSTEISHWERAQRRAVKNWLTKYKPKPDARNLEKVRGYLEAFHHLCEVEDWKEAHKILFIRLNTPTNEKLHNQLNTWGYYHEQANLYSRLLDKLSSGYEALFFKGLFLNGLGGTFTDLAEFDKAIDYSQQSLTIAREIGNDQGEAAALGNLGVAYRLQGNYDKAIECYQQFRGRQAP
jgi:tetratricopeptide (TPR) repeat protein